MPSRVSDRHLGLLVDALLATDAVPGLNGPDIIGQTLSAANLASIATGYDNVLTDDVYGDVLFAYERHDDGAYRRVGPLYTYKQVECFGEQCIDWPDWDGSAAQHWMAALSDHLLAIIRRDLPDFDGKDYTCPEYETAPWGVPDDFDQI